MKSSVSKQARHLLGKLAAQTGLIICLVAVFAAGYFIHGFLYPAREGSVSAPPGDAAEEPGHVEEEVWTCSMHPQIRQPKPGLCPLCGMKLILADSDGDVGEPRFTTSEGAKALMDIQTSPVERRFVTAEVRMVGKVDYDETRLGYITAWVPGRIDRMYVDYTGIQVNQGDHMVYLYSPELLVAQDELRRAAQAIEKGPDVMRKSARTMRDAARDKLSRWGLTDQQIDEAEKNGVTSDHVTIYAPMGGTVIYRNGQEGMYVDTGTRIYTLADLSQVWVKLDAYESDLMWLRYGQPVTFETEAYPGEAFEGKIAFIDPLLDKETRTVRIRVNVPNAGRKLKPEMFVRAVVRTQVAAAGKVMDPDLAGKWMCPMHPSVVSDGPGSCDICKMPLVRAEDQGFVTPGATDTDKPLAIPVTAALMTGKRAIVYVEVPDAEKPTFEGREVVLGPRAGDYYIVRSGLEEGERVVTNGNFKIDSALQLMAKPSMMSPEGGAASPAHDHSAEPSEAVKEAGYEAPVEFQAQLRVVVTKYVAIQTALAGDDAEGARKAVAPSLEALAGVDMSLLDGDAHMAWMKNQTALESGLKAMQSAETMTETRQGFKTVSNALIHAVQAFGAGSGNPIHQAHCPMAFEFTGADWLQEGEAIRNPYFGSEMLECGTIEATFAQGERSGHE